MSDILNQIVAVKREEVAAARRRVSLEAVRDDALSRVLTRDFEGAHARRHGGRIAHAMPLRGACVLRSHLQNIARSTKVRIVGSS